MTIGLSVLAAALICTALIIVLRPLLQRYALARPNARSSHVLPTPQGAGIAVIATALAITSIAAGIAGFAIPAALFAAAIFLALVGFVDDIKTIPVLPRLLLQASAVGAVLIAAPSDLQIVPGCPLALERAVLLLAGLWFVNLVNFMDGLDLMTVAEVVPVTAALILLWWLGEFPLPSACVAAALCGAMLGFAPFNRPIARVFLGDVGSLSIGLLLGWCLLQLAWHQQFVAALILPLYYLADATITLLRRIAKREPFWAAHRSHFYQRATDKGFAVIEVVGHVFVLNIVLGAIAVICVRAGSVRLQLLLLAVAALLVAAVLLRFSRGKKI